MPPCHTINVKSPFDISRLMHYCRAMLLRELSAGLCREAVLTLAKGGK